ncbi:hypothetical protein L208DRAFT_1290794 [Tricholoma matsutake]|nr:hypothetical protein L208DRAFT_1290794 [Tricholoma matsutake 945]
MHDFIRNHKTGFAWTEQEQGSFCPDFFPPIKFPIIPHTPWAECNIPIPPGLYKEICKMLKKKIEAGVCELSNSLYRSRWFCIAKKDVKSLRIVHSLKPLNQVTIQHSGIVLIPEHLAEHACSGMLDLYVTFNKRLVAESS